MKNNFRWKSTGKVFPKVQVRIEKAMVRIKEGGGSKAPVPNEKVMVKANGGRSNRITIFFKIVRCREKRAH
jgi:hypothetical protein